MTQAVSQNIVWNIQGQLTGWIDREGYRFAATVSPVFGAWQALGLMTPIPGLDGPIESVLDDHQHQVLGEFADMDEARQAVERFLREAAVPAERCGCGEVGAEERKQGSAEAAEAGKRGSAEAGKPPDPDPDPEARRAGSPTPSEPRVPGDFRVERDGEVGGVLNREPGAGERSEPPSSPSDSPDRPLERTVRGRTIRFDTAVVTLSGVLPPGFSGPVATSAQDLFRPLAVMLDPGQYSILLSGTRYRASGLMQCLPVRETGALSVGGFVCAWLENFTPEPQPFRIRFRGHGSRSHDGKRPVRDEQVGCSSVVLGMIAGEEGVGQNVEEGAP